MSVIKTIRGMTALVTGGASGLGRSTVERFVKQGAKVVFTDLPTSRGQDVVSSLDGKDVAYVPGDISNESDIRHVIDEVKNKFGRLDVVVNCAGIARAYKLYNFEKDVPQLLSELTDMLRVNTTGTFNIVRLAAGLISQNAADSDGYRGIVINTAGFEAFHPQQGQSVIAAASRSIVSMTLPFARDFASQGIRCCTIAPGLFKTPLLTHLPEEVLTDLVDAMPCLNRFGDPDEFAHSVQFLVENPMMNGEILHLNGGMRLDL